MSGESTPGGGNESKRLSPTPFLTKTYQLVDDSSLDDLISWNGNGTAVIVWRPAEFARDLLPKYFKHNNFSSFVRQLNTYVTALKKVPLASLFDFKQWLGEFMVVFHLQGFRKVVPDRWKFANDCFRKGAKVLLKNIQRRKISTSSGVATSNAQLLTAALPVATAIQMSPANSGDEQVLSSNSSPAATGATVSGTLPGAMRGCTSTMENLEENDRLRRENTQLSEELNKLQSLCSNVYSLMSNYTVNQGQMAEGVALESMREAECGGSVDEEEEADEDKCPRIFGVSIGAKRSRRSEEYQCKSIQKC